MYDFLKQYLEAAPSSKELVEEVIENLKLEKYYVALRKTNLIISHESKRLESIGYDANSGKFNPT